MTAAVNSRPYGSPDVAKAPRRNWLGAVIAGVLVLDAFITLALEVLFLPLYVGQANVPAAGPFMAEASGLASSSTTAGAVALPLSALAAAVINVLLVRGMASVSSNFTVMSMPLAAWTIGYAVLLFSGPGGDIMLIEDWPTMALLSGGLLPAGLYLYWRATSAYAGETTRR